MPNRQEGLMPKLVHAVIHFIDGTSIKLVWPRQENVDRFVIMQNIRKAIEADKLVLSTDGDLMLIPTQNIKYIHLTPGPVALPQDGVIKDVQIVG
jgi:hypothetical protein